jgi:hypothetical protein
VAHPLAYGVSVSSTTSSRTSRQTGGSNGRPPAGNRLPVTRERRPALAALAVILILLGAAGSALIALRSGEREGYLTVSKSIQPGEQLTRGDFGRGQIAGDTGDLIKASRLSEFVGTYARTRLYKSQYLTEDMLTKTAEVPAKGALVGVSLENGRVPSDGLEVDDVVRVIRVPASSTDGTTPEVLVGAAIVTDVESTGGNNDKTTVNTTQITNATVLVPTDKSTAVAAAAAAKTLVLIKLAPGTKPEIARGAG